MPLENLFAASVCAISESKNKKESSGDAIDKEFPYGVLLSL